MRDAFETDKRGSNQSLGIEQIASSVGINCYGNMDKIIEFLIYEAPIALDEVKL